MATLDPTLYGRAKPETVPLSEWGYKQAKDSGRALSRYLKENSTPSNITLYTTNHSRIAQSKDAIIEGLDNNFAVDIQYSDFLQERNHGKFDGLDKEAQKQKNPEIWAKLYEGSSEERYTTKMPDGESLEDVALRLKDFLLTLNDNHDENDTVIIVTHGGNCAAIRDALIHDEATWVNDHSNIPDTADVIELITHNNRLAKSETVISGKKRPTHLPADYKAVPYDKEWQEAHLLQTNYKLSRV